MALKLRRVEYQSLNSKQQEIYNFQKASALLADYGFNCIKLADDWQGADFLAYHKDGNETLRVQLKSRVTINEKYRGQGLWMIFPANGDWYLIEHDDLLNIVSETTGWLDSNSWINHGAYSSRSPSQKLLKRLAAYRVDGQR